MDAARRHLIFEKANSMENVRVTLLSIAAIVIAAPAELGCGGIGACGSSKTVSVTPDVACSVAAAGNFSDACGNACGAIGDMGKSYECFLPTGYAFATACTDTSVCQADAATGPVCPKETGDVTVTCSVACEGRRTAGIEDVVLAGRLDAGAYLAGCAYLEEVSVHAFDRLASELEAHGAPPELVAAALQARRDEERHTRLKTALARRFGGEPPRVRRPAFGPRSLLEIARENAVEGCIRETYGAALGLVGAPHAPAGSVRDALAGIAQDECDHAELSWKVADWLLPRLGAEEREVVARAMRAAVAELRDTCGDGVVSKDARALCGLPSEEERQQIIRLLEERVFRQAA
jgi:hypothetical protein